MRLKNDKKKIIIVIISLLVVLLAFGTFNGYQNFRYDQRNTQMDMKSLIQLQVPNEGKPVNWEYVYIEAPKEKSFDTVVFAHYLFKKGTFQRIQYKDVEPQWFLLPTKKDPKFPSHLAITECLKNFNENLLYNPKYEQYRSELNFKKSLTMDDLLNNPQKVMELIHNLFAYAGDDGWSFDDLADNPCPSQYLSK